MKTALVIAGAVIGVFVGGIVVSLLLYGRADSSTTDTYLFGAVPGAALGGWLAVKLVEWMGQK